MSDIGNELLRSVIKQFGQTKYLADRAIAQVSDEALQMPLDGDVNSIAIIMKHMAGNMHSRWTDFLTSDGEKPWRDRDAEFADAALTREQLFAIWENGWSCCLRALESLTPADLTRTVTIRGQLVPVVEAILRQIEHYGYHVGQIIMIARIHVGPTQWKPLTIPPGQSQAYNRGLGYDPSEPH